MCKSQGCIGPTLLSWAGGLQTSLSGHHGWCWSSKTRLVCVNCTATSHLSNCRLSAVLPGHLAGVPPPHQRLISASKAAGTLCFTANLDFKEIHVEARPGDVMAWRGRGAAGPAQDVPTGSALDIYYNYGHHNTDAARTVVMIAWQSA